MSGDPSSRRHSHTLAATVPLSSPDAAAPPAWLAEGGSPLPHYRLIRKLGGGGFGEVWEANGPGDVLVALKFIRLTAAGDLEQRALKLVKNVRHPHLVFLFGIWEVDGWLIVGMERTDGTLSQYVRAGPPLPRAKTVRYLRETAEAIDFLNKPRHFLDGPQPVGLCHGDIKPPNLLLVAGHVKVGDFGLVQALRPSTWIYGLTPHYAAPELFQRQPSRWSDQYALAVSYCELCGGLPFTGTSFADLQLAHETEPPDLSAVPGEEQPVVARALAKNPAERWRNCRTFVNELLAAHQKATDGARDASPTRTGRGESRPKKIGPTLDLSAAPSTRASLWGQLGSVVSPTRGEHDAGVRSPLGGTPRGRPSWGWWGALAQDRPDAEDPWPVLERIREHRELRPARETPSGAKVWCLTLSPCESFVAWGEEDGNVFVRAVGFRPDEPLVPLTGHRGWVTALAFHPNRTGLLASAASDGNVRVWDKATQRPIRSLTCPNGPPFALTFLGDGQRLLAAGADGAVWIWDWHASSLVGSHRPHRADMYALTALPDGVGLVTGDADGVVRFWDSDDLSAPLRESSLGSGVRCLVLSPRRSELAAGLESGEVVLLGPAGEVRHRLAAHRDWVRSIAFMPDSGSLIAVSDDEEMSGWNGSGALLWRGPSSEADAGEVATCVAWCDAGLLVGTESGQVYVIRPDE